MNSMVNSAGLHRLPVYIVIDTSVSMFGQAAEAFKQGIKYLLGALKTEDFASDIYISLLTFNNHAARDIPLMNLDGFRFENPVIEGASRFAPVLELLNHCLEDDLRPSSNLGRGDYKALVFIFTDGRFNDRWESKVSLIEAIKKRCSSFVLIGCGSQADYAELQKISPALIRIDCYQPGELAEYIELSWL